MKKLQIIHWPNKLRKSYDDFMAKCSYIVTAETCRACIYNKIDKIDKSTINIG